MSQRELFPLPDVPSPCIRVCTRNAKGYCTACWRNRNERFHWHELSFAEKCHVLDLCRRRKVIAEQHQQQTGETIVEFPKQLEIFTEDNAAETDD